MIIHQMIKSNSLHRHQNNIQRQELLQNNLYLPIVMNREASKLITLSRKKTEGQRGQQTDEVNKRSQRAEWEWK